MCMGRDYTYTAQQRQMPFAFGSQVLPTYKRSAEFIHSLRHTSVCGSSTTVKCVFRTVLCSEELKALQKGETFLKSEQTKSIVGNNLNCRRL